MQDILVSAVMTTYNFGRYAADAVQSVLAQTYSNIELIVIDDGSTDDTRTWLAPFMDKITYIHQQNQGIVGARNRGLSMAKGQYIALLDGDDLWHPRRIEVQMKYALQNPDARVIASDTTIDLSNGWPKLPDSWPPPIRDIELDKLVICARFAPSGVMLHRECLEKVGTFRQGIGGADDRDLWIRYAGAGLKTIRIEWPLVFYRNHGQNFSNSAIKMETVDERMLNTVFDEVELLRGRGVLRRKAFSCAACMASFLYTASGDQLKALSRIIRSLVLWPFQYDDERHHTPISRIKMMVVIVLRMLRLKRPHVYDLSKGP